MALSASFPMIRPMGLDGFLVSFADSLTDPANRAALAFQEAVAQADLPGLAEMSTSLVSVYVRFRPAVVSGDAMLERLRDVLHSRDWDAQALPSNRRLWRVPTVYGGRHGPQLEEAAELAGLSLAEATDSLGAARVRVLAIGFAPGQPYLGLLDDTWNIPRQTGLTPQVPSGALVVAIRQLVLFTNASPTGWRHVGQTRFRNFAPEAEQVFALRPGDEMQFDPCPEAEFETRQITAETLS